MPKVYQNRYCCRCGICMRVSKPTFVCPDCPVFYSDVVDKTHYYDYVSGKIIGKKTVKLFSIK